MPSQEALAICQETVNTLHHTLECTRVTLRTQADPDGPYPVLVESRSPGARSLLGDTTIDVRKAATFIACGESGGKMLIQEDLLNAKEGVVPPKELLEVYGALAQMLCPIMKDGKCVGVVSVHEGKGARKFTEEERLTMVEATRKVAAALELDATVSEEFMMG